VWEILLERNPVVAGMVKHAEDYPYSSARYYVKGEKGPLITSNLYYEDMGQDDRERREHYKSFLLIEDPYTAMVDEILDWV